MSRGLGKLQRAILIRLRRGERTTAELLTSLEKAEEIARDIPRKQSMGQISRTCASLVERDLICGRYEADSKNTGRMTRVWRLA